LSSGGSLRAGAYGQIRASGAIDANDVFVVQGLGIVSGSAAALGGLTRGANLTLSRRAVIGHQALDQATANNLGASADLLFGVSSDFSTDASRALGAGTPWLGLAAGEISAQRSITRGTLNIDTTALREFAIVGFPFYQFGSRDSVSLRLTDTAGPLAFNLVGGAPVPARVSGIVRFDASAPVYAAFTRFVVADNAMLRATRAGCFGATTPLPVDLTSGTLTADANANSTNLLISAGDLTLLGRGNVTLLAKDAVSLFAGLSISRLLRPGAGVLQVSTNTAALNSQNRFKIASAPVLRGKTGAPADQTIVDPFVVHDSGGMGDFLSYDTNGLKVATYSGTDAAVANAGEIVNQVTNTIVSGARSLYGLRFATAASSVAIAVSGGTLNLGVLSDGPPVERAPQAGLIMTSPTTVNNNTFNISSALDFGGCELCACVVNKSVNSVGLLSGPVTGTGGITKFGVGRLQLSNAANSIDGSVTIWDGTLQINGGNGLNDTAMVHVAPFGTFDLVNATNNTETLAALSGVGMVRIAAGKTLAVTGMLTAGGASGSLTVTNGGTLYLADNAVLAFDLDCVNTAAETPRLALNNSTLLLGSNVRLRINSLANRPFGSFSRTFALIGGVMSGTFAGLQTPAGTIGLLVYDAGSRTLSVRLNPAQPGVVMQFK
jgi:autotransporter-associated beta strand protein